LAGVSGSGLVEQARAAFFLEPKALPFDEHQGNAKLSFTATVRAEAAAATLYIAPRRDRSRYRKSLNDQNVSSNEYRTDK
jgi:hypothetical protein